MKSSVEQLDPTRVKISVEVPYAELKPSVDEAYKTIAGQVTVPGFRQGKIPARIIDQRIGRPTVIQEAINNGLDAFYRDAVEANDLKPLGQPEVEISEVPGLDGTEDGDLVFTVDVDVRPEITLPAYDSITVEVDPIEVTDADVEAELEQLRSRFGTLTAVDRPAAKDDFVTLDLVAKIDDEEIDQPPTSPTRSAQAPCSRAWTKRSKDSRPMSRRPSPRPSPAASTKASPAV